MKENISLKGFNTFGIDVAARYYAQVKDPEQALELISSYKEKNLLILGGGSNVLFTKNFDGLLLHNTIPGKEIIEENDEWVRIKFGAGENWHKSVLYCIENKLAGIENLSLIPGNCGAAPMQNIGAYGVEIKEVFHELEALHLPTGEFHTFSNEDCNFGYRESVFKNIYKNKYLILNITLQLQKKAKFNISYGAIESELESMKVETLSIKAISDAVINIRSRKLPNPAEIGNAGSFFKNPVISKDLLLKIQSTYPNVVNYPVNGDKVKLAAAWLIDQAGWKGKRFDNYGVHKNQALVLVNYGNANGNDIYSLSEEILDSVNKKFQVKLEREVNII